jgi:hypothetical protein
MTSARLFNSRQRRALRALARELDEACPGLGVRLCPARAWSTRALALSVAALAPCGTAAVLQLARPDEPA